MWVRVLEPAAAPVPAAPDSRQPADQLLDLGCSTYNPGGGHRRNDTLTRRQRISTVISHAMM